MNVWDVDPEGKSDEQIAAEGFKKMESYMEELGLTMHLKELGVTEEMLPGIVESTLIMDGGYKVPDKRQLAGSRQIPSKDAPLLVRRRMWPAMKT